MFQKNNILETQIIINERFPSLIESTQDNREKLKLLLMIENTIIARLIQLPCMEFKKQHYETLISIINTLTIIIESDLDKDGKTKMSKDEKENLLFSRNIMLERMIDR